MLIKTSFLLSLVWVCLLFQEKVLVNIKIIENKSVSCTYTFAISLKSLQNIGVFSKWSRTFAEFSEFREFRESEKSLRHELGSV